MKNLILIAMVIGMCACEKTRALTAKEQADGIQECTRVGAYAKVVVDEYGSVTGIRCQQESPEALCTKKGGVPIASVWDGHLADCIFPPAKK